jgi:hypothetical protein
MEDLLVLLPHLLITLARLLGPGGTRAVVAGSVLMEQQLVAITRLRPRVAATRRADLAYVRWETQRPGPYQPPTAA